MRELKSDDRKVRTFHSATQLRDTRQPQAQSHANGTKLKRETKPQEKKKKIKI